MVEAVFGLENPADPGSLVSCTDLRGLEEMAESGSIATGMLPKVSARVGR